MVEGTKEEGEGLLGQGSKERGLRRKRRIRTITLEALRTSWSDFSIIISVSMLPVYISQDSVLDSAPQEYFPSGSGHTWAPMHPPRTAPLYGHSPPFRSPWHRGSLINRSARSTKAVGVLISGLFL